MNIKKINNKKILFLLLIFSFIFVGCNRIDNLKVKLGIKNSDFEYIKQGKVQKIVIQNTRDKGFRFIVTHQNTIRELYDILSSAKEVKEKTSLEPDYIFEMYEGHNKVHKFKYVVGLDKKDSGNLYSNNKIYIVSKRIDNDIIKTFWNIRKPKDFKKIYYNSLLDTVENYVKENNINNSIGINLKDDIEVAKFILSSDLQEFQNNLNDKFNNVEICKKDKKYDIVMTIKTEGYRSILYKGTVTFWNRKDQSEKKYYIFNEHKNGRWNIKIDTKKPKDF